MASRDGQQKLLEKVYKLGQEVGYFNHSEVGWVHREYRKIRAEAQKLGIEVQIKDCYEKGKDEGAYRKQHDMSKGMGKKTSKQGGEKVKVGRITTREDRGGNAIASQGTKNIPIVASDKPQSARKPTFVHRIRTTLEPTFTRMISPYTRR